MNTVVLRCDASASIGIGHAIRCYALAQAFRDAGFTPVFLMATGEEILRAQMREDVFETIGLDAVTGSPEDSAQTRHYLEHRAARFLVLDGYDFGLEYQRSVRDGHWAMLVFDDEANRPICADFVLNQNLLASEAMYAGLTDAYLLLGTRYAALRRQFQDRRRTPAAVHDPNLINVLISIGGSDPHDYAAELVDTLEGVDVLDLRVLLGPAYRGKLANCEDHQTGSRLTYVRNVSQMADQIRWADVAVIGAGSTTWEVCCLGVPAVLVVSADNQRAIAAAVEARGAGRQLDPRALPIGATVACWLKEWAGQPEKRRQMSKAASSLVDGLGAARVVQALMDTVEIEQGAK